MAAQKPALFAHLSVAAGAGRNLINSTPFNRRRAHVILLPLRLAWTGRD